MPEDVVVALQEIASLLRRRVEQQDRVEKRTMENIARNEARQTEPSAVDRMREEAERRRAEAMGKMEQQSEQARQERERRQEEETQFRQSLLAALGLHNALLERLLSREA